MYDPSLPRQQELNIQVELWRKWISLGDALFSTKSSACAAVFGDYLLKAVCTLTSSCSAMTVRSSRLRRSSNAARIAVSRSLLVSSSAAWRSLIFFAPLALNDASAVH